MRQTHIAARIIVSGLFIFLYLAFFTETAALFYEFWNSRLAWNIATLDSHNFVFFPVAGLLVLVAFWRPTVYLADALGRNLLRFGRAVLVFGLVFSTVASIGISSSFNQSTARSMFEIAPHVLAADQGIAATEVNPPRSAIPVVLTRLRILAAAEGGLSSYKGRCDTEWLTYSDITQTQSICFPSGAAMSVAECCGAKTAFRSHLSKLHDQSPSNLATVHRWIQPIKIFFLMLLLSIGILLVRYRKPLERMYGEDFSRVSFGVAVGGVVMLGWPLLNASYLETVALLTGDGVSSRYAVVAPLVAFGFGVWALLLMFFHFRSFPSQIESAARLGGVVGAAFGVLRYDEITAYITQTLGVGGSIVATVVFVVAIIGLIVAIAGGASDRALVDAVGKTAGRSPD